MCVCVCVCVTVTVVSECRIVCVCVCVCVCVNFSQFTRICRKLLSAVPILFNHLWMNISFSESYKSLSLSLTPSEPCGVQCVCEGVSKSKLSKTARLWLNG